MTMVMAVAVMMVAGDEIVFNVAGNPLGGDFIDGAGAASDNFDADAGQDVDCALAHVAGEHDFDAFVSKYRGYVGFAAAALWGVHAFLGDNLFVVVQSDDGVVIAMAEVVINVAVSGGQSYFHVSSPEYVN